MMPHGRCPVRRRGAGLAALVVEVARPYRGWLAVILTAMTVETLAGLAAPWPLKIVLDNAIGHSPMPGWMASVLGGAASDQTAVAAWAATSLVLIALVGSVASYIDSYYTESVGQWVANDLRLRIYDHLENLSFRYYDTHETGALLSTMTDDVATVQDFVSANALGIVVDVMTIGGMLALMLWLDWSLTILVLAITPVLVLITSRLKRSVKTATREVRQRESDVVAVVQTGLESVRTVQALSAQAVETARLARASRNAVTAALRARRIKSSMAPIVAVIVAACTALVLWRGSLLTVSDAMTIGSLTVYLAYLTRFFKPVQDLAKMTTALAQTQVALERIVGLLDIDMLVEERPDAIEPPALRGAIELQHVAFGYSSEVRVLKDVNVTISPGAFVGVVGATGSGKSTIASLIPRFYDPEGGAILVDGTDIRRYTLRGLRRQIGLVLQETVLFRGTIRENIAYGQAGATDADIWKAAQLANADQFIARLPNGYDTVVGDRGATLSGGERQRLGIARAFIRNLPILILDEPTASLDPESERLVAGGLQRLMKGRTVIMISHRLNAIRNADQIVVLDNGAIAEQGTHEELLARDGVYAGLYWASTASGVAVS